MTDPVEFISAIHKAGVEYLLIGRQAMIAYGIPAQTMDYDIYINGSLENTQRFLEIARDFGLFSSVPEEKLPAHLKFKLEDDIVIDVFRAKKIINVEGEEIIFAEIYKRREILEDESGFKVYVPSIDELIKLKKTGRERDTIDIKYLIKLKERMSDSKS